MHCFDWDAKKWLVVRELRGVAAIDDRCALFKNGTLRCFWGTGKNLVHHPIPIRGITRARRMANRLVELADGSFVRADVDNDKWSVVKLPQLHGLTSVGRSHDDWGSCAIQAGHVVCWLDKESGNPSLLGRDPAALGDVTAPARLSPDIEATALSVGNEHACAVDQAGAVWCWGRDRGGDLGAGHASYRDTPTRVVGIGS